MSLEEKVNDKKSSGFIKKAAKLTWKLGMAGLTTAYSLSAVGTLGITVGAALAGGVAIGGMIKKKSMFDIVSDSLTAYSAVNAVIHPIVALGDATFPLIPNETLMGKAARSLYAVTAYNAAFVASYDGAVHLIDNYMNPKGLGKSITDNFYNKWKRVGLGFGPGYALAANGVHNIFGMPTFAVNALPFGAYNTANPVKPAAKKENARGLTPAPAY